MTAEVIPLPAVSVPVAAERVLRGNDNGSYTVPSRSTYPHQWNWELSSPPSSARGGSPRRATRAASGWRRRCGRAPAGTG